LLYVKGAEWLIRAITGLVLLLSALSIWRSDPKTGAAVWKSKEAVVGAIDLLILLLTFGPIFRLAHRLTFASYWLFPLLDGEWKGEIRSNWPRIKRMAEAAAGGAERFDTFIDEIEPGEPGEVTPFEATITSGLFDFQIELRFPHDRTSRTVFVRPEWHKPEPPMLSYVYRQKNMGEIVVTDAREHVGAAEVHYVKKNDLLTGFYWTSRQSHLGLNTAGVIQMHRVRKSRRK
jgi:hypothetical protein